MGLSSPGGSLGVPIVRKFPFAYNTPGLLTGATIFVPTIGDIWMDGWIEVDTIWDGTTPTGDVGQFIGTDAGFYLDTWYGTGPSPGVDMTYATSGLPSGSATLTLATYGAVAETVYATQVPAIPSVPAAAQSLTATVAAIGNPISLSSFIPAKFTTADPVKVCVSQNGKTSGADPGSTQGAGFLYVVTVTPVLA